MPKVEFDTVELTGGLDLVTPPFSVRKGYAREAQNYEADFQGGYRRIAGYERTDGRSKPSDATYAILNVTITGAFAVGNTVTGVTSAATAVVVAVVTSTNPDYLVLTKVTGTFVSGETLNVGGAPQGTASSAAVADGASSALLHAQYTNLAADEYRNDIGAVPGSGVVRGVWRYNGVTYAWRDNAGGTAAAIYKSSSTGWQAVGLFYEVSFTAASGAAPAEGATITQGGVTATLKRLVLQSGTFGAGTAAGRLIVAAPAGGSFSAGVFTAGITATCSGAESQITLLPGGRYRFINANFGGATGTKRIYGADGVNRGFEFDGVVLVPIVTGMTTDTPTHVREHKKHLFFSFGSSAQHSGTGLPYQWTPVTGAAELAMGDDITGFITQPGSETSAALAIFTRNGTSILYGSSSSDWLLVPYREELGAFADTIQDVGFTVFMDDRGIMNLQTAQEQGNFAHAVMSALVYTYITERRNAVVASCISRDRSQYRIFFTDRTALYVTIVGRKLIGIMPIVLADIVRCMCSVEDTDGTEVILFGSDDGFVYQMEKGTSFDGDAIEGFLHLVWNHSKSPEIRKRYRNLRLEMSGDGYVEFQFAYELDYGSTGVAQAGSTSVVSQFARTFWDSFTWDSFFWDGRTLIPSSMKMQGTGTNISLKLSSNSDYFLPHRFTSGVVQYTPRRVSR